MMRKPVCRKCEVALRPEVNGVIVAEMFQENTKIYKLWEADLWKCPVCGVEIVVGFAQNPFMEHFEGELASTVMEAKARGRIIIKDKEIR